MSDHQVHHACAQTQCGLKPNLQLTSNPNIKEAVNSQLFPVEVYPLVARCYAVQFFTNVVNLAYTQSVIQELEGFVGYYDEDPTPPPRALTVLYCSLRSMAKCLDLLTCKQCLMRRGRVGKKNVAETNLSVTDGEKLEVTQELREIGIIAIPGQTIAEFWTAAQKELKALKGFQESFSDGIGGSWGTGSDARGSSKTGVSGYAGGSRLSRVSYAPRSSGSGNRDSSRNSYGSSDYGSNRHRNGNSGSGDSGSSDDDSSDSGTRDSGSNDYGSSNDDSSDSGSSDFGSDDYGNSDKGSGGSWSGDSDSGDSGSRDSGTSDSGSNDYDSSDSGSGDFGNSDTYFGTEQRVSYMSAGAYSSSGSGYDDSSGGDGSYSGGYDSYGGGYNSNGGGYDSYSGGNDSYGGGYNSYGGGYDSYGGRNDSNRSGSNSNGSGYDSYYGDGYASAVESSIGRPSSQQVEEGMGRQVVLTNIWKLQLNNAAQAYARGAPNLPELRPVSTFNEAAGLIEELIPFFAWLLAVADPSSDRDEMIRIARKFEEWQALKAFPRVLIIEGLNQNAFVLARIGLLFAVDSLLEDGTYCVENDFLLPKELMSLRSYRVYLCDELKPHMWNLLSRFVEYEDLINVGIKKAWHYANELYQDAEKPHSMKKIFERGEPFRLALGTPKQTGAEKLLAGLKPAAMVPAHRPVCLAPCAGVSYPAQIYQYVNPATGKEDQSYVRTQRNDSLSQFSGPKKYRPAGRRTSSQRQSYAPKQSGSLGTAKSGSYASTQSPSYSTGQSRSTLGNKSSKTFRFPNRVSSSSLISTKSSGAS